MDARHQRRMQARLRGVSPNTNPQHFRVNTADQFCCSRTVELKINQLPQLRRSCAVSDASGEMSKNKLKIETEPFDVLPSTNGNVRHSWKLTYEEKESNEEDVLTVTLLSEPVQSMFVGLDFCLLSAGRVLGMQGFKPCFLKPNFSFSTSTLPPLRSLLEQNAEKRCVQVMVIFRHFCLPESEDKFQLNRLDTIERIWNLKHMPDVSIKTDLDDVLRAHKAVLGAWSPVFERMLRSEMKEGYMCEISISDFSGESVKCFLRYLYGENVQKVCRNNAEELLAMAEKYQVAELKTDCEDWLVGQVSSDSICQLLVLADLNRAEKLVKTCIDFIIENRAVVIASEAWKELQTSHFPTFENAVEQILGPKWVSQG